MISSTAAFPLDLVIGVVASLEVGGACLESLDLSKYFMIPSVFSLAFSTIFPVLCEDQTKLCVLCIELEHVDE